MVISLIGYRGSGKSTVARQLAARIGWQWIDTDAEIERRAGKSIAQIFHEQGEPAFRELEAAVVRDCVQLDRYVLALGGGAILRDASAARLHEAGPMVWLQADPEVLWSRIGTDPTTNERRPALTSTGGVDEIRQLLAVRLPLYARWATLQVDTADKAPDEIAAAIAQNLGFH